MVKTNMLLTPQDSNISKTLIEKWLLLAAIFVYSILEK